MIHLTLLDGAPVLVNPMQVFSVSHAGEAGVGCVIWSSGMAKIEVRETLGEVEKRFRAWVKG